MSLRVKPKKKKKKKKEKKKKALGWGARGVRRVGGEADGTVQPVLK